MRRCHTYKFSHKHSQHNNWAQKFNYYSNAAEGNYLQSEIYKKGFKFSGKSKNQNKKNEPIYLPRILYYNNVWIKLTVLILVIGITSGSIQDALDN